MNKLSLYTVLKVLFTAWFVLLTLRVRALVTETAFRKSEICWWNLIGVWREGVEGRTVHNQAVSYPEKLPVPSRRWKNWKTAFSLWNCVKRFPPILSQRNLKTQPSPAILNLCLMKLGQRNHVIIVTSSFSKSFVFKMFSAHTKT